MRGQTFNAGHESMNATKAEIAARDEELHREVEEKLLREPFESAWEAVTRRFAAGRSLSQAAPPMQRVLEAPVLLRHRHVRDLGQHRPAAHDAHRAIPHGDGRPLITHALRRQHLRDRT